MWAQPGLDRQVDLRHGKVKNTVSGSNKSMTPTLEREEVKVEASRRPRPRPTYLEQFDSGNGFTPAKKGLLKESQFKPTKSMIPAQQIHRNTFEGREQAQGVAYHHEGSQLQTVPTAFKST